MTTGLSDDDRALAEAAVLLRDWFDVDSDAIFALLEQVPVAVAVTIGAEHRCIYANALFRRVLAPRGSDFAGRTIAEIFGPNYPPERLAIRSRVLQTGQAFAASEVEVDLGLGAEPSYWDINLIPVTASSGRTRGVLTIGVDVTAKVSARRQAERKAEEARRREAEARFHEDRLRLAVEATRLGLWEWDLRSKAVYWSPRQREIFGVPPDAPIDYEAWAASIHPEDRAWVTGTVAALLDPASAGVLDFAHRVLRPDGGQRWIAAHGRMLFEEEDGERRPVRLIGTVRDITEEREADRRAAEALAAKEVLLKEVNHRVKNSLQLVSAILALQGRDLKNETSRREFEEARLRIQAVALVHERLYKADDVRRVDLAVYLDELCRDLRQATLGDDAGISIELDIAPVTVPNEKAVPLALIVNELVTNALKYAYPERTGVIRVAVERLEDGAMRLCVSDEGVGLAEDFEDKAESSLGMRLVRALARQIGGAVEHERRTPGCAFTVAFRLGDEDGAAV